MELDELKAAWRAVDSRIEAGHALNARIFKELKLERTRSALRPLWWLLGDGARHCAWGYRAPRRVPRRSLAFGALCRAGHRARRRGGAHDRECRRATAAAEQPRLRPTSGGDSERAD
jgi:hypothetical protein